MIPLAHAGGVDEIAFMLLPAAVFWVVFEARRRRLEKSDKTADDAVQDRTEDASGR